MEIVGFTPTFKTVITGVEMFKKLLDEGQAGDNVGLLLRGIDKDDVERGHVGDTAPPVSRRWRTCRLPAALMLAALGARALPR